MTNPTPTVSAPDEHHATWTIFTNHAHVLLCLAANADLRIRDLALLVGITERAVQRILRELTEEGFLQVSKHGRRNHYIVVQSQVLRHPVEAHANVGDVLTILGHSPFVTRYQKPSPDPLESEAPPTESA